MNLSTSLSIFRIQRDAMLPVRSLPQAIGYDVHAYLKTESNRPSSRLIPVQGVVAIPTRTVVLPPSGYCLLVCSRSGMASRGVSVANAPGVIDPDYTGELIILLQNIGWEPFHVKHEDRIAQLLIIPCPATPSVEEIQSLPTTDRGGRGFGSTGD